jgi:YqjK-like protein
VSTRTDELANKRRRLQLRCAVERLTIADLTADIEARLGKVDGIVSLLRRLVKHPLTAAAAVSAVTWFGPWRLLRWAGQGMLVFNAVKKLRRFSGK